MSEFREEVDNGITVIGEMDTEHLWWWRVESEDGDILAECEDPASNKNEALNLAHRAAEEHGG